MPSKDFEIKTFNLDELKIRREKSKYPFHELEVGQGFAVPIPTSGISGRVSAENKKTDKKFVSRADQDSTSEHPKTWVIRTK